MTKVISGIATGVIAVTILSAETGNRIPKPNDLSKLAETSITLNGKKITIEYNAPAARGRKIEGGLIPSGTVWRLGADAATTLTSEADLMIGTLKVPKGVHTLYLLNTDGAWKLVVNNQVGQWGTVYDASKDLGRTDMKVEKAPAMAETFKLTLKEPGVLEVAWGTSVGTVPVKVQ